MISGVPIKLAMLSVLVAGLILTFDLSVPLGVAGGVPYVALVLIGTWCPRIWHLFFLAATGSVLTILGLFLSPPGGILWVVLTNRILALFAIWITAFLIAIRKKAENQLREREEELRRVSRLGDMGQMAAALAHELGQPLTAIGNYIQAANRLLEKSGAKGLDKVHDNLDKAVAQGRRAAQIIRSLREFIKKGKTKHAALDANKLIEEAASMALAGVVAQGYRVTRALDNNLPPIMANKIQIQQVVVNLLRNSVEAMAESKRREITISSSRHGDKAVEISVSDSGPGLPEEVSSQLFKPFVTTKPDGMGVGLSICRSIIDDHGGRFDAAPNPGGGTVFSFTVPVAAEND